MRKALLSAQRTADQLVAEAERKSAQIMNQATQTAQAKSENAEAVEAQEEARINKAKEDARKFIETIEMEIKTHLELLENLKKMDLTVKEPKPAPRQKPFDYDKEEDVPLVISRVEPTRETAEEIANKIVRLYHDEEKLRAISAAGIDYVRDNYSQENAVRVLDAEFGFTKK